MQYTSCHLLEHGICFYNHNLCTCCYAPQEGLYQVPYIKPIYLGAKIDIEDYCKRIKFFRDNAKQNKFINSCKNCYKLETKEWDDEIYIDQVYITHFEACNADCIYCITGLTPNERQKHTYEIVPVLDDLKEKGILKENCEFHIGGGEFTIYPECDEIIEKYVLSGYTKHFAVATNGIKYSESLFKAMDKGLASIIISLDCGGKKIFEKIKRVNAFDSVIENLKLYTRTEKSLENTFLKYIVIPNVNDNKKEFQKFLSIANDLKIRGIKIDLDGNYCRKNNYKLNWHIKYLMKDIINMAIKQNFDVEIFQFYKQCLNNN